MPKYKKIEVEEENNDFYDINEKVVRMYQDPEDKSVVLYENWSKFENELYGKDLSHYFYYIDVNTFKYYKGQDKYGDDLYGYYYVPGNCKVVVYKRTGKVKIYLPEEQTKFTGPTDHYIRP